MLGHEWRYALQTEIIGRGLDGIVVGLDGQHFKKEVGYLMENQAWPFI